MTEYRWSAERVANCWPNASGRYGVRLLLNGEHAWSIWRDIEADAQSLIDWINRTDLPGCPEWATLVPVASGAALKANDPDGEWEREAWAAEWRTDHHNVADRRYPVRRTPAPAEPLTERVPLAECLGREVLADGKRRLIQLLNTRTKVAAWYDANNLIHAIPVAPDGTVEVLRRSTEDGER